MLNLLRRKKMVEQKKSDICNVVRYVILHAPYVSIEEATKAASACYTPKDSLGLWCVLTLQRVKGFSSFHMNLSTVAQQRRCDISVYGDLDMPFEAVCLIQDARIEKDTQLRDLEPDFLGSLYIMTAKSGNASRLDVYFELKNRLEKLQSKKAFLNEERVMAFCGFLKEYEQENGKRS